MQRAAGKKELGVKTGVPERALRIDDEEAAKGIALLEPHKRARWTWIYPR